ncbi:hypothetical protein ACFE04_017328 [Oxalis oulophora]
MVRFSCFNAHPKFNKPKKTLEPSMQKTLEHFNLTDPEKLKSSILLTKGDDNDYAKSVTSSSLVERAWKSEDMRGKFNVENDVKPLKKSQSLGDHLYLEGRVPSEIGEEETYNGNSSDSDFHNRAEAAYSNNYVEKGSPTQSQEGAHSVSEQFITHRVNNESIFSIGDQHSEKDGLENSDAPLSIECGEEDFRDHTPPRSLTLVKSRSVPNFGATSPVSEISYSPPRPRSTEDLRSLDMKRKEDQVHDTQTMREERNHVTNKPEKDKFEISEADGYDSYDYSASVKDWVMPVIDESNSMRNFEELPNSDYKTRRIKDWVNDLQYNSEVKETEQISHSNEQVNEGPNLLNGPTAVKVDSKVTPGMEVAKKYISSLNASASTAQLANHGLAVIPFLSAFVSLKVLNLSGNAIVRITAGALPRGLHLLNLSKNNISTIEGLRELTRLRVLDLSYNRILRIGHGLASCSSLKELYLAGNKISEVEGLHRLLKLTVLDLRFNKISTAKGLGQLAANYNSLQAISLEGNPAQKNVGDEQLKKHLQGLLPKLAYFNRQPTKATALKDPADRSVRLGISERALRSEHKSTRKASHGLVGNKSSSSLSRRSHAGVSPKRSSRSRHLRLPPAPSGTKASINPLQHNYGLGNKIQNLKAELSIRKSRSMGTLGGI